MATKKNSQTPQAPVGVTGPATPPPASPSVQAQPATPAAATPPQTVPNPVTPAVSPPAVPVAPTQQQALGQRPAIEMTPVPPNPQGLTEPAIDATPLEELARTVRAEHQKIVGLGRITLKRARRAGRMLSRAYARIEAGGGDWETWVRDECGVHPRTANNYIRIAANWDRIKAAVTVGGWDWADLTVTDVLTLIKTGTRGKKNSLATGSGESDAASGTAAPASSPGGGAAVTEPKSDSGPGQRAEPKAAAADLDQAASAEVADPRPEGEQLSPRSRGDVERACEHHGILIDKLMAVLAELGFVLPLLDEEPVLSVA